MGFISHEQQEKNFAAQQVIIIVVSAISMFFSAFTLFLILDLQMKRTIYTVIIIALTITQLIYDTSFLFFVPSSSLSVNFQTNLAAAGLWIGIFFGILSTIISNILTSIVCYVVYSKKAPENYFLIYGSVISSVTFAFLVASFNTFFFIHGGEASKPWIDTFDVYNTFRLISIIWNFAGIGYIFIQVLRLDTGILSRNSNPLYVLAKRLIFYPLVQAATRLAASVYQLKFDQTISTYNEDKGVSLVQTNWMFATAVLTGLAGIGYFLVFITMQKGAYERLCYRLCCLFNGAPTEKCGTPGRLITINNVVTGDNSMRNPATSTLEQSMLSRYNESNYIPTLENLNEKDDDELLQDIEQMNETNLAQHNGTTISSGNDSQVSYRRWAKGSTSAHSRSGGTQSSGKLDCSGVEVPGYGEDSELGRSFHSEMATRSSQSARMNSSNSGVSSILHHRDTDQNVHNERDV